MFKRFFRPHPTAPTKRSNIAISVLSVPNTNSGCYCTAHKNRLFGRRSASVSHRAVLPSAQTHRLMIAVYRQLVRFKVTDSAHTAEMSVCPHSRAPDPSPRQTESLPFRTACTPVYSSAPHRALLLYSRHF